MPCVTYFEDHPEDIEGRSRSELENHVAFLESALCGALNALETVTNMAAQTVYGAQAKNIPADSFYNAIDFKSAGFKKNRLVGWHKLHRKQDAAYRAEEAAKQLAAQKRAEALAKLTPEDRKILGLGGQ